MNPSLIVAETSPLLRSGDERNEKARRGGEGCVTSKGLFSGMVDD
jgi:hypothetical protein